MEMTNSVHSSPGSVVRNIDRVFEDAQSSGELKLNSRKLKDYPPVSSKYDLSDIVYADLSKNRFSEFPLEVCKYALLEHLDCYNNVMRFIPDAIINLQTLTSLDLSRNQLTNIPVALCHLPLQVCILRNNRLVSIPEEICSMKCLIDLDVSCNEITIIPPQIGNLSTLQSLNLKRNLLVELPLEICQLKLISLDVSANRISSLPTQLRLMTSLQELILDHNPMTFPPSVLCRRGRIHIFKFLEIQAIKEDKRGIVLETEFQKFRSPSILSDIRFQNGFASATCRKSYTFDSGYNTSDCDSRSQESQELNCGFKRYPVESPNKWDSSTNHFNRNQISATLCNYTPVNAEEDRITEENASDLASEHSNTQVHIQTYREFKEALKQQRASESTSVYKKTPGEENAMLELSLKLPVSKVKSSVAFKHSASGVLQYPQEEDIKAKHQNLVSQWQYEPALIEPHLDDDDDGPKNNHVANSQADIARKLGIFNKIQSCSFDADDLGERHNFTWPKNTCPPAKPLKSSFTMKREFDKAREEQELITKLREILENRLKLKLPEEMECALLDGVFLCHLANHVHNNSVACIHVPSPAVPKLTVAKCRRNVDNFLEACRRLGVPNDLLCSPQDVLGEQGGLVRVAITVQELMTQTQKT